MCRKLAFAATVIAFALPAMALAAPRQAAPAPAAAPTPTPGKASPEQRRLADQEQPLARAAFWNQEVQIDPRDAEAGLKLSAALRALGQYDQAAQAARQVSLIYPDNVEALLEAARARIEGGQAFYALDPLRQAISLAPRDWRPLSLQGVAFEQVELPDDALAAYDKALTLSPNNPAVLSNQAMFHLARGDAAQAEFLLRRAVAQPGATVQIRQNLALALAAEGKLSEAERMVRMDLPPELANNNIAYLRALSASQAPRAAAPTLPSGG
ncbi:MAG: tetratricopeptide repeat protein [Alphaproteobacteria bacterium]